MDSFEVPLVRYDDTGRHVIGTATIYEDGTFSATISDQDRVMGMSYGPLDVVPGKMKPELAVVPKPRMKEPVIEDPLWLRCPYCKSRIRNCLCIGSRTP